ncbi:hypothetical protein SAMN05216503_3423 [Polaribacter sp. KT25b]|uniref:DUF6973 domain-containing protein n=1 Tax=Polaribacter sp. KT25b TaxID=1855336 RepID=UPI0008795048|nr:hypothetical protein [Polaribacter sp. KT25b]SDS55154.1 hypothetical protein SAMN05216503_3423 [Polaribacter sp. KT25b]
MKKYIAFLFLVFTISVNSQSNFKKFFKLSGPIKSWVLFHPFKATKALKISEEASKVSDSIKKTNLLDGDDSGGQVDAFRHAYWMARLHQEIGESAARSLGKAHEKENYLTFKKWQLEEGVVPDEISSKMDLYNNEQGLKLISRESKVSKKGLIYRVLNAIKEGEMKIIKKDEKGDFLTCDGNLILKESLKGKWENNKCLISSEKNKKAILIK